MKKLSLSFILFFLVGFNFNQIAKAQSKDTIVIINTIYGNIKLKLYEDTPLHRHNFLKLVQQGFYDSTLFHRVINGFMVQGGDPDSKRAAKGAMLGNGDAGYTIPAEIVPAHFHKKGALAAARQGDDVNPTKASSGCQFYIVQGKKFAETDITAMESRMVNQVKQTIFMQYISLPQNAALKNRFIINQEAKNSDSLAILNNMIQPIIEAEYVKQNHFQYSDEQKKSYSTLGGAPHLDGGYTVFGEVIEGLDVIDRISLLECDKMNRPLSDVRMKVSIEIK